MEKGDIEKEGMIVKCPSLSKKILHFLVGNYGTTYCKESYNIPKHTAVVVELHVCNMHN